MHRIEGLWSSRACCAVLASWIGACGAEAPPATPDHAPDGVVVEVAVPGEGAVAHARILRIFSPESRSVGGGGGGSFGSVMHTEPAHYLWMLEVGDRQLTLGSRTLRETPDAATSDPTRMLLRAGPDGSLLAYSIDAGATWIFVALALGPQVLFRGLEVRDGDPFAGRGSARELLLHGLEEGAAREPSLGAPESDASVELLPAGLHQLCERPGETPLGLAVAGVFVRHVNPLHFRNTPDHGLEWECLATAAREDATVRSSLRDTLRTASVPQRRALAAWTLARSGGAEEQEALAASLIAPVADGADVPAEGEARLFIAWALASLTASRGEASAAVIAALANAASDPQPPLYAMASEIRAHAIRGLASLGPAPSAHDAIVRVASGECRRPLPSLSLRFVSVDEALADATAYEAPCWAQAVLRIEAASLPPAP